MNYALLIIVLLCFIVVVIDIIPQFNTWQSRIHIGRFKNAQDWEEKVLQTSKKWLKNLPTVKLTDQTRLIFIDILRGNYKRTAIQSWQEAALILGLSKYSSRSNDKNIQQDIQNFIDKKMSSSGKWKIVPTETDQALLAYSFLQFNFMDHQKYKPAYDETYKMIKSLIGVDGTVAYKSYSQEFRFVDTLGFICPFLINYGIIFNVHEAVDLGLKQITEYQKYGMMKDLNIPCHTYNVQSKIPTGLFGWGRGSAWWVSGIVDSWKSLPDGFAKENLKLIIIQTADSILKFQNSNGSFPWLLFNAASRADSSTTAVFAWFFTVASEIPELKENSILAREKCLSYLQSVTRRDGTVDFSQGDTKGIGMYSLTFDRLPFTQGFLLRTLNAQI